MTSEDFVYGQLSGNGGVTDLVDDRIYPTMPAQDEVPEGAAFVVFTRTETKPTMTLAGAIKPHRVVMRLDFWANDDGTLQSLAAAILAACNGTSGTGIQSCLLDDSKAEPEFEGHHRAIDFVVWER